MELDYVIIFSLVEPHVTSILVVAIVESPWFLLTDIVLCVVPVYEGQRMVFTKIYMLQLPRKLSE